MRYHMFVVNKHNFICMKLPSLTILVSCLLNFAHFKKWKTRRRKELDHADQPKIITTKSKLHCMALHNLSNTSHQYINLVKPIAMVLKAEDNWHLAEKICDDYSFLNSREVSITLILTTLWQQCCLANSSWSIVLKKLTNEKWNQKGGRISNIYHSKVFVVSWVCEKRRYIVKTLKQRHNPGLHRPHP